MNTISKTYKTSEIAKIIGIHPNTVRLYEDLRLVSPPERKENGYRVFTQLHLYQFRLARIALQIEVLQNGLRKKVIEIIKATAECDFDTALNLTDTYIMQIDSEMKNANEAESIVMGMYSAKTLIYTHQLKRRDVSLLLGISMDTLRNWEMNGLLKIKRKENGYRVYTDEDLKRLRIIRTLKCANYSLSAILRMLCATDRNRDVNINTVLNTPRQDEDIVCACDKLVYSLHSAKANAQKIKELLIYMKNEFSNPPI